MTKVICLIDYDPLDISFAYKENTIPENIKFNIYKLHQDDRDDEKVAFRIRNVFL